MTDHCPHCGAPRQSEAAYCRACGARVAAPAEAAGDQPAAASPHRRPALFVGIGLVALLMLAGLVWFGLQLTKSAPEVAGQPPAKAPAGAQPSGPASGPGMGTHPPFSDAALRTARVPAYCEMPELTLVDGKVPDGKYGEAHGQLQLEGDITPVRVDLDHDGTQETVAVYACGATNVAAGAHWPEMLVVYGWDGAIRGHVTLREHMLLPVADTMTLEEIEADGDGVAVRWTDTNRISTFMERSGTLSWDGAVTFDALTPPKGATLVSEDTAFATPSGNIACDLVLETVQCRVFAHDWKAPPAPADSMCGSGGDYGDYLEVSAGSEVTYPCKTDTMSMLELLTSYNGPQPPPAWFIPDVDPIALEGGPLYQEKAYALSYGRTLRKGVIECTVEQSGLTCTNGPGGHGFTVSKESLTLH